MTVQPSLRALLEDVHRQLGLLLHFGHLLAAKGRWLDDAVDDVWTRHAASAALSHDCFVQTAMTMPSKLALNSEFYSLRVGESFRDSLE